MSVILTIVVVKFLNVIYDKQIIANRKWNIQLQINFLECADLETYSLHAQKMELSQPQHNMPCDVCWRVQYLINIQIQIQTPVEQCQNGGSSFISYDYLYWPLRSFNLSCTHKWPYCTYIYSLHNVFISLNLCIFIFQIITLAYLQSSLNLYYCTI